MHPMAKINKQTDGHRDSMTESAQWSRFSEKVKLIMSNYYIEEPIEISDSKGVLKRSKVFPIGIIVIPCEGSFFLFLFIYKLIKKLTIY